MRRDNRIPGESDGWSVWWYVALTLAVIFVITNPSILPWISSGDSIQNVALSEGQYDAPQGGTTDTGVNDTNFSITVENNGVERCGLKACIDATATIGNVGKQDAYGTTVTLRVYADDEQLFTDSEQVGDLSPGESYSTTQEESLGLSKLNSVRKNDCQYRYEFDIWYNGGEHTTIQDTHQLNPETCKII